MFERIDGVSLDVLRVFESAARQLSFTAAASELGTSQPAISQQIKRLEQQLATRLFDRVYRGIALTDAGELLLSYVQDGLQSLDAGLLAVTAQQQHEVLQVATDFAFAAYWLMPRLQRFHQLRWRACRCCTCARKTARAGSIGPGCFARLACSKRRVRVACVLITTPC